MGTAVSRLESLTSNPIRIVMLGLDSAGKTTVLYQMKYDHYTNTLPTIGFNCEKVKGTLGKAKGVTFTIWDVGGQEKIRPLWRTYTRTADGIVFVLDSADEERIDEAKMELLKIAKSKDNTGVPLLILANKQDLPGSLDTDAIEHALGLSELGPSQLWHTHSTCAITGEGLDEALEHLYNLILKKRRSLKQTKRKR